MGQHRTNPTALAAAAGLIGSKKPLNGQSAAHPRVNVQDLERKGCHECGGTAFMQEFSFFVIPTLLQPMVGGDELQTSVIRCTNCGAYQNKANMQILLPMSKMQPSEGNEKPAIEVVR